ncbi:hypothetical protein QFZ63_003696 [Streptomyces sp. B3I7]|uniref:hypothetical protein n=1 Tax=unclassified Streptomyces TaxID=2593676 RepID=UPI002789BAA0|nr:hypothetical protein [Streptomyces sp. B3I8]MDQ0811982.1 hypothetical protein [Streptomyces sp. B3I7]
MRGLGPVRGRGIGWPGRALKAVIAAVAVIAALGLLVSACATGGTGARDEGPAGSETLAPVSSPSRSGPGARSVPKPASPSESVPAPAEQEKQRGIAVKLVLSDPEVSPAVKRQLKPCVADEYPVDVSYGGLTHGSADDIVVNVMTCGDAVGVGAYVYRLDDHGYDNVFKAEDPPVYAEIDRGDLVVTQQLYRKGDSLTYPSSEEVVTYRWSANRFVPQSRVRNDYSNAVDQDATAAPSTG